MSDREQNRPSAFGKSLELRDGDVQFVEGDLSIVSGQDNLAQAMRVMIETPPGTDIFNVNYGFDFINAISQPLGGRVVKEYIRLNIIKSLSRDDRVREVRDVIFDDDPRFFEYASPEDANEVRQRHSTTRRWQALVVLQTIAEREVIVNLEGTGL
jgi:phage baseplate assembly protein W